MTGAADLAVLTDRLWLWQVYDPAVKSDLFASAVKNAEGLLLIDPIPLAPALFAELMAHGPVAGILVTNSNHLRAAADFGRRSGATIFAAERVISELGEGKTQAIAGGEIMPGVSAIPLAGAAAGEMAFHFANDGGTVVVGDALINFEPYGFTLLPAKYCSDQKQLRASLRQLLDWPFERLLFAHGLPVLSSARARLETLLR